jgi:hypothetical protein
MSDDKAQATGYDSEKLPRRDPMTAFAQYGTPPPVNPGRNYDTPPGTPPWGSLYQDIGHRAPKKARRWWIWVLVAGALMVMCAVGGVALIGAGGKAVVSTVDREAADRQADIKITGCEVDSFGLATVTYTVHNSSSESRSYLPEFNVESKTGTVYGQAADVVNDLKPGKDYRGKAIGSTTLGGGKGVVCTVTGA